MNFIQNEGLAPMAVEKIKILVAVLELPAKQHCQIGPFNKKLGKMGRIGCCQTFIIYEIHCYLTKPSRMLT